VIIAASSLISGNTPGVQGTNGGGVFSAKDNALNANNPDGTFAGPVPLQ
jgi:hypothetical protein